MAISPMQFITDNEGNQTWTGGMGKLMTLKLQVML
jgi:hypothetical protein